MRLFVALAVPPAVDDAIDAAERGLRAWARGERAGLTWVPPGARHVTLRFLGERPDADNVIDAVARAAATTDPPTLTLGSRPVLLGATAVALPVAGADRAAAATARELRVATGPFRGHVTVARVRPRPAAAPTGGHVEEASWVPEGIDVIESRPGATPRYRTLATLDWGA